MLDEENFYPDDDHDLLDGEDDPLGGGLPEDLTEGVPGDLEPDGDLEDLPGPKGLPLSRPLPQEDGLEETAAEDKS